MSIDSNRLTSEAERQIRLDRRYHWRGSATTATTGLALGVALVPPFCRSVYGFPTTLFDSVYWMALFPLLLIATLVILAIPRLAGLRTGRMRAIEVAFPEEYHAAMMRVDAEDEERHVLRERERSRRRRERALRRLGK